MNCYLHIQIDRNCIVLPLVCTIYQIQSQFFKEINKNESVQFRSVHCWELIVQCHFVQPAGTQFVCMVLSWLSIKITHLVSEYHNVHTYVYTYTMTVDPRFRGTTMLIWSTTPILNSTALTVFCMSGLAPAPRRHSTTLWWPWKLAVNSGVSPV